MLIIDADAEEDETRWYHPWFPAGRRWVGIYTYLGFIKLQGPSVKPITGNLWAPTDVLKSGNMSCAWRPDLMILIYIVRNLLLWVSVRKNLDFWKAIFLILSFSRMLVHSTVLLGQTFIYLQWTRFWFTFAGKCNASWSTCDRLSYCGWLECVGNGTNKLPMFELFLFFNT